MTFEAKQAFLKLKSPIKVKSIEMENRPILNFTCQDGGQTSICPLPGVHQESLAEVFQFIQEHTEVIQEYVNQAQKHGRIQNNSAIQFMPSLALAFDLLYRDVDSFDFRLPIKVQPLIFLEENPKNVIVPQHGIIKVKFGDDFLSDLKVLEQIVEQQQPKLRIDTRGIFTKSDLSTLAKHFSYFIDYIEGDIVSNDVISWAKQEHDLKFYLDGKPNDQQFSLYDGFVVKPSLYPGLNALENFLNQAKGQDKKIIFSSCYDFGKMLFLIFELIQKYAPNEVHGLAPILDFQDEMLPEGFLYNEDHGVIYGM